METRPNTLVSDPQEAMHTTDGARQFQPDPGKEKGGVLQSGGASDPKHINSEPEILIFHTANLAVSDRAKEWVAGEEVIGVR